jgi:hypothetical protein
MPVDAHRRSTLPAALAVALALAAIFADEPARFLIAHDPARPTDAALVLAGDPDYERTKTGARLVLSREARLLILTGGEPGPGDSAESLRDVAVGMGVPLQSIRMERISSSTHESLIAIRDILERERVQSLAIVTSPYHQRRASWAAKRTLRGVALVNRPADPSSWRPEGWWKSAWSRRIVVGEYLKLAYYVLRGWA